MNIRDLLSLKANRRIDNIIFSERIYDTYPSDAIIEAMPNPTVFTTRGFYAKDDGYGCVYYATTGWRASAMRTTTKYVVPLSQPQGEVYLPYYGVRTGDAYPTANTARVAAIPYIQFGSVLRLPAGHFYFDSFPSLVGSHLKLRGTAHPGYTNDVNTVGITYMHFPNLTDGQAGITSGISTISDIEFYGNPATYNVNIDRTKTFTDPDNIVTETNTAMTYAIKATMQVDIQNCTFRHFYYGIYAETANTVFDHIVGFNCHTVASVGNDTRIGMIFGFNIRVVLQIRGSITSAVTVRGDSVVDHLVHVSSGTSIHLTDLDADYCMKSILHIGNENWGSVQTLYVNGIHGRHGVYRAYDKTLGGSPTVDAITTNVHTEEYPMISVSNRSALHGAKIIVQGYGSDNPMDVTSNYATPSILFAAGLESTVQGVNIELVGKGLASTDTEPFNATWISKRVKSLSGNARNLELSVETAADKFFYKRTANTVTYGKVTTEAVTL